MPLLEVALVVVAWAAVALSFGGHARKLRWEVLIVAVCLLVGQLVEIGAHWQVVPAWLAVLLAVVLLWVPSQGRGRAGQRMGVLLLGTAALLSLSALPLFRLPKPTGEYAVGTTGTLHWADPARNLRGEPTMQGARRELAVQIWYPATTDRFGERARYARFAELAPLHSYESVIRTNSSLDAPVVESGAAFPVLLFGPRWGGSRGQDTFLAEDLASHGYAVIAIDHPLNAARVELGDGSVVRSDRKDALSKLPATSAAAVEAVWAKELELWTGDNRFVLDKLVANNAGWFAGRLGGRLDFARVGAFGHSFGGAASLALLGADPRVHSAVNLDGWTFQGLDRRTTQPILVVYEGSGETRHPEHGTEGALDTDDNAAVDHSLQQYGGLRAYVAGTQHMDFTDGTLVSPFARITATGPIEGERVRTITRGLVLSFFDRTLKGTGSIPQYPEVHLREYHGVLPPRSGERQMPQAGQGEVRR